MEAMTQAELSNVLDRVFRFKVGDLVVSKADIAVLQLEIDTDSDLRYRGMRLPKPDIVLERYLQQCHGGVQQFAIVKRHAAEREELVRIAELELERFDVVRAMIHDYHAKRKGKEGG